MDLSNDSICSKEIIRDSAIKRVMIVVFLIISLWVIQNPARASSNLLPQLSAKNENTLKEDDRSKDAVPPFTSVLEQVGPSLNTGPLSQQLSSKAAGIVNSQASQQIEQLLSFSNGKARASINSGLDGKSRFEFKLDYLNPWFEGDKYTLYSQLSSHRWNDRNQLNIGVGYRYNVNEALILGSNMFFDKDLTRSHNRVGLGLEVWGEKVRSSLNYYLPLSGWKSSNDSKFNQDPLHYALFERAARGWDINLEALLLRPLSARMTWFQWYGKEVDALGTLDRVSNNPFGLTLGLNWQPIPLLGFVIEETFMSERLHDLKVAMNFTWNFNESMQQQLDFKRGKAMTELSLSRHDFVTRNNNIILEYKREELFRPLYFSPERLTIKAGASQSVNLARGGYGGVIKYTSDQNEIAQVETDSGFITPLKRGETTIRAQEFQQGWWQTPVNNAFYTVTVLPGDIAPTAKQVSITGTPDVGETLAASYQFVNNEGNDEIEGGSPVVWFNENESATSLSEGLTYKVRAEDRGQNIIFQVTPMNKDSISGGPVKHTVNIPSLKLSNLLIANGNTSIQGEEVIVFPQASTGQLFLTAIVKDHHDKPVPMAPLFWSQLNAGLGTITHRTGVTDNSGEMIIRYEGITTPGNDTVTVSLQPHTGDAASFASAAKSLSRNIKVEFSAGQIDPLPGITLNVGENKAVSPSGGIVGGEYLFTSKSAEIVAIEQEKLSAKKVGVTEITVYQKPTATVNAPKPITFTVTVTKRISEELQVKSVSVDFGAPHQPLDVQGGNNGKLSFKSSDAGVVKVSEKGELTFVNAGQANITVSQAATDTTAAPVAIKVPITVSKILGRELNTENMTLKVGDVTRIKVGGGNGTQGGELRYRSDNPKIASVDNDGKVTAFAKGTTKVTVTEVTSTNYLGQTATADVSVGLKDAPALTAKAVTVNFGTPNQSLNVQGGNNGKLSFKSSDAGVVKVSDKGELTFVNAGQADITVSQAATDTTAAPAAIKVSVTVNKILGRELNAENMTLKVDDVTPIEVGGGNGTQGGELRYRSDNPKIASVDNGGKVTAFAKGTTKVTVTEATSTNYLGQTATADVSVGLKDAPALTAKAVTVTFGTPNQSLNVQGGNNGKLSYKSSDAGVVKVSDKGELTFVNVGQADITVSQAATDTTAAPAAIKVSVTVKAGKPSIEKLEISGSSVVGSTLTSSYIYVGNGVEEGATAHQWMRGTTGIPGATSKNYVITVPDAGQKIYLKVTARNKLGVSGNAFLSNEIKASALKPAAQRVSISGKLAVDNTLSLSYEYVGNGFDEGESEFIWLRNFVVIKGATEKEYLLSAADADKKISVKVIPKNILGDTGNISNYDLPGKVRDKPKIKSVSVAGKAIVGQVLNGTYSYESNTLEGVPIIQWLRNGAEIASNAKNLKYTVTDADVGSYLSLRVVAVNSYSEIGSGATSSATEKVAVLPSIYNLSISGTQRVGETLSAHYTLQNGDAGKTEKTITWERTTGSNPGTIPGATLRKYTLTTDDIGAEIRFHVTATNSSGLTGGSSSAPSVGPVVDRPKPKVSNLSVSTKSCGSFQREYTADYDYDAQGGSAEGNTVIMWSGGSGTAYGRITCLNIYNSSGYNKLTITPKNKDGIVGDVVEKSL